ncbi:MAG: ATP synthase F1 subunit gamma [Ichthyobacteriaceae bacterium]|nr:ATP synthase F1 subunit gamma [Ichthyobacteriaceae bacterium]
MANLKEIKNRITSVSSTRQITSAMKMVSAAKLKKAQDAAFSLRPYADKLKEIIQSISSQADDISELVYTEEREVNKVLIIAISSNRGLCGAFNANVGKKLNQIVESKYKNNTVEVLTIGKKINDIAKKQYTIVENQSELFEDLTYENTAIIADWVMKMFARGSYDKVEIVYNKFKNAAMQILTEEQMLPIVSAESESSVVNDYIFEPNKKEILVNLMPTSLKIQLHKAILDSVAAEHGARMTSMHKATDNATDLIGDLKLTYNKARQASITNEILEIVGGAEALNG